MIRLDETWMDQIYELMAEAFPLDERRNKEEQVALFQEPNYHMYAVVENGEVLSFLAGWNLGSTRFVEHLASASKMRGGGIGKALLSEYMQMEKTDVVLEVEKPDSTMARRRIGFYERLGFHLYPHIPYVQPAFHSELPDLPLCLMYSTKINDEDLHHVIASLYSIVYKREVPCF